VVSVSVICGRFKGEGNEKEGCLAQRRREEGESAGEMNGGRSQDGMV